MLHNFAFIDSNNLYQGTRELGWNLDYQKFRNYLKTKYDAEKAYLFIGYIPLTGHTCNGTKDRRRKLPRNVLWQGGSAGCNTNNKITDTSSAKAQTPKVCAFFV